MKTIYIAIIYFVTIFIIFKILRYLKRKSKKKRIKVPEQLRKYLLKKYNYQCALCPSKISLETHHRDNNPSNNEESNLIITCHDCHRKHGKR